MKRARFAMTYQPGPLRAIVGNLAPGKSETCGGCATQILWAYCGLFSLDRDHYIRRILVTLLDVIICNFLQ